MWIVEELAQNNIKVPQSSTGGSRPSSPSFFHDVKSRVKSKIMFLIRGNKEVPFYNIHRYDIIL